MNIGDHVEVYKVLYTDNGKPVYRWWPGFILVGLSNGKATVRQETGMLSGVKFVYGSSCVRKDTRNAE